jgi:eukaryotic-like serine/threonine-protein kinase
MTASPPTLINCPVCKNVRESEGAFCEHCGAPTASDMSASEQRTKPIWIKVFVCFVSGAGLITLVIFLTARWTPTRENRVDNVNAPPAIADVKTERPVPEEMAYVPGGEFLMGNDHGDSYEQPAHRVVVRPFYIDIHEVTCAEYAVFVNRTGHKTPESWGTTICPKGSEQWPVTGVDWFDASAYASWKGGRLPTEEEWEFAARGTDGRRFPWGNEWRPNAANAGESSTGSLIAVGSYPEGKSPFGLMDMAGNAWEWTSSNLQAYPEGKLPEEPEGQRRVIRGGSWVKDSSPEWTTTYRGFAAPAAGNDYTKIGFRCVRDINVSSGS